MVRRQILMMKFAAGCRLLLEIITEKPVRMSGKNLFRIRALQSNKDVPKSVLSKDDMMRT